MFDSIEAISRNPFVSLGHFNLKLADTVLWAGGGSLLLGVPCVDKPEFANARGFFKFAGICFGG